MEAEIAFYTQRALEFLFWLCVFFVLYGYFGYPLIISLLAKIRPRPVRKGPFEPSVTLIVSAYNEERMIRDKIINSLKLDYPKEKLEIVIASDGSTDSTVSIAKEYTSRGIILLEYPKHHGKFDILNTAVPLTKGEIIVFSDASGMLEAGAVREMTANFNDPEVGCVCGYYKVASGSGAATLEGYYTYLDYDITIKRCESNLGSTLGAHGALYAIRRGLFELIPKFLINDDFYIPMRIVGKGYRVIYEDKAVVTDRVKFNLKDEFRRRVRIGFGNWQQIFVLKKLLRPSWGLIAWEFFSHKVLRIIMPFFILTAFLLSFILKGVFYEAFSLLGITLIAFALIAFALHAVRLRSALLYPFIFWVIGNTAYFIGTIKFILGEKEIKW